MKNWFKNSSEIWIDEKYLKIAAQLLILALVLWMAHYFQFREFGLYEDDYAQISPPLGWNQVDLINYLKWVLTWPQGRPLQYFFTGILSFISGKLGGLSTAYIIGFVIQTTNAILFNFLLRRLYLEKIAIIGAVFFGLFPADTTHIFLMHTFALHISLMFLLIASLCYLSGHRVLAYVVSLGALLTYETPYIVFLGVPLLALSWDRKSFRKIGEHALVWTALLVMVVLVRVITKEARFSTLDPSFMGIVEILSKTAAAMVVGPAVAIGSYFYGIGWTITNGQKGLIYVFLSGLPVFGWLIFRAYSDVNAETDVVLNKTHPNKAGATDSNDVSCRPAATTRILLASMILLSLGYGFSFTHFPPTALSGRMTSVHLAATFGGSLLVAVLCQIGFNYFRQKRTRFLAGLIFMIYLAGLLTYRFSIQLDYKKAWENQRKFWSDVMRLVPDLSDGMVIFAVNTDLPNTRYILSNSWSVPLVLKQIYRFPDDWNLPPRVFLVDQDWKVEKLRKTNLSNWEFLNPIYEPHWEMLPEEGLVLLEMQNGLLIRRSESLMIEGFELNLKPPGEVSLSELEIGPLHAYLIESSYVGP